MRDFIGQLKQIDLKSIDLQAIKTIDMQGIDVKRLGTAAATLVIALGAGYYMQSGQTQTHPADALVPAPVQTASVLPAGPSAAPETTAEALNTPLLQISAEEEVIASSDLESAVEATMTTEDAGPLAVAMEEPDLTVEVEKDVSAAVSELAEEFDLAALEVAPAPAPVAPAMPPAATDQCAPTLTGSIGDMAMMKLEVSAPCHANSEVEFSHAGLRFSEYLDEDGYVQVDVPAMVVKAHVTAHLANDAVAKLELSIPEASQYHRAALVWRGATGLQLHAFEKGAEYGEDGHLWADHPGGMSRVSEGQGGFISVLGSVGQGYASDIYTFPAYMMRSVSGPAMSIEAQVMETTCGDQIEGKFLRANGSDQPREMMVKIAAPGCDAVGEYLVLRDMPQELLIALN